MPLASEFPSLRAQPQRSEDIVSWIFFGTSGDLGYLQGLVDGPGFVSEVIAQDELTRDGWQAQYFTFRLT